MPEINVKDIENEVKNLICEELKVDPDKITRETSFVNDLNIDSLELLNLVMEVEEEFDIIIPDEEANNILTIGDAIDCMVSLVQRKNRK